MSVSLNHGCMRASFAVIRFFGSYTKMRLSRSRNCRLKSVWPGIVSCHPCQQAETVEQGKKWTYGKLLHCFHVFLGSLVRIRVGVVQLVVLEISSSTIVVNYQVQLCQNILTSLQNCAMILDLACRPLGQFLCQSCHCIQPPSWLDAPGCHGFGREHHQ